MLLNSKLVSIILTLSASLVDAREINDVQSKRFTYSLALLKTIRQNWYNCLSLFYHDSQFMVGLTTVDMNFDITII